MSIPVLYVEERSIAIAWERSLRELWERGKLSLKESFGASEPARIKECAMLIVVRDPLREPRIHPKYPKPKAFFIQYAGHVVEGSVEGLKFKPTYTYYGRHRKYRGEVDQVRYIVRKLEEAPYSNRALSVTWDPLVDEEGEDVPCNISIWCKVVDGKLVMHTYWRSRDALRAALPNMYAFTELQKRVAEELAVEVGEYVDFSSSYHVYEECFRDLERFLTE